MEAVRCGCGGEAVWRWAREVWRGNEWRAVRPATGSKGGLRGHGVGHWAIVVVRPMTAPRDGHYEITSSNGRWNTFQYTKVVTRTPRMPFKTFPSTPMCCQAMCLKKPRCSSERATPTCFRSLEWIDHPLRGRPRPESIARLTEVRIRFGSESVNGVEDRL